MNTLTAATATLVSQVAGVADGWATARPSVTSGVKGMNLNAADLGIVWDRGDGHVNLVFGDNYGDPWKAPVTGGPGTGGGSTQLWRPNALLVSDTAASALSDGLRIVDNANALNSPNCGTLVAPLKGCVTCIPTAAISLFGTQYMAVMDVTAWGANTWTTKQAQLCKSTDNGQTWSRTLMAWPNTGAYANFQQFSFTVQGDYLLAFATPDGRAGNGYLARVPLASSPEVANSWQYYTVSGWSSTPTGAVQVLPGPVPELSARWDDSLGLFLVTMCLDSVGTVLLTSDDWLGPWDTQIILPNTGANAMPVYGGYQHPWSTDTDLWFIGSSWNPYQTYLFHSALSR